MAKNDISYLNKETNIKFNFRVAVMAYNDNKILLQKNSRDPFYSLIGGRVSLGESTLTATKREIKEEVGIEVKTEELKLIEVLENFFTYNSTKYHELLFIYKLNNIILNGMDNFKTLDSEDSINKWVSINEIDKLDIRPEIIKTCYNIEWLENTIIGE